MPRAVFRLLWSRLGAGRKVFAYIVNRTKGGDHRWVLAHVTPSLSAAGEVVGHHSNRRKSQAGAVAKAKELFATVLPRRTGKPSARWGSPPPRPYSKRS